MKKILLRILCYGAFWVFLSGIAWGAEFCVDPGGGGDYTSLQDALNATVSNGEADTIKVVQGTYTGNFYYSSTNGYSIALLGGYTAGCASRVVNPANTLLDGNHSSVVLLFNNSSAGNILVDGFTLQNGTTTSAGGGIYIQTDTTSGSAGAITLTNNIIQQNSAANAGGGVYAYTFSSGSGTAGNIIFVNNIITGNSATGGGGVNATSYSSSGTAGTVTLINNTITGNIVTGSGYGGGAAIATSGSLGGGNINFYNNIIWGNTAPSGGKDIFLNKDSGSIANGYNNDYDGMLGSSWTHSGNNIDANPLFVGGGDYHLRPSSPCIDTGTNSAPSLPLIDFEGDHRVNDGNYDGIAAVDMGADEYWSDEHCVTNATELQAALTAAQLNSRDSTMEVVQGTYMGNFTYTSSEGHSIILLGGYTKGCAGRVANPAKTILDGSNSGSALHLYNSSGGDIFVDGFTIQHGNVGNDSGGGVFTMLYSSSGMAGTVILTNNVITGNSAKGGGGVFAFSYTGSGTAGSVLFSNNTFSGNTATGGSSGGGVYAASQAMSSGTAGTVNLTNNTFIGNNSSSGGGVSVTTSSSSGKAGTVTLTGNTITGNSVTGSGGGVFVDLPSSSGTAGAVLLTNNTISGNTADVNGGGVYAQSNADSGTAGTVLFTNNMITGNTAGGDGGGIEVSLYSPSSAAGTVTLTNNTITGNTAGNSTNGAYLYVNGSSGGTINVYNNIIWGNAKLSGVDIYLHKGATGVANVNYNDYAVMGGDSWNSPVGNITPDPLFVGGGNYHLQYNSPNTSPCIDVGYNSAPGLPEIDFDGDARILEGTNVDMGADEFSGWVVPHTPSNEIIFGASTLINKYQPSFQWTVLEPFKSFTILFSTVKNDFTTPEYLIAKLNIPANKRSYTPSLAVWKKIMTSSSNSGTIRDIYWRMDGVIGKGTWTGVARHFRIDDLLPAVVQSSVGGDPLFSGTPPTFLFDANYNVKLQMEISSTSDFLDPKKIQKVIYAVANPNVTPKFQKRLSAFQWNAVEKLIGIGGTGYFRIRAWDGIKRETLSEIRSFTIQ